MRKQDNLRTASKAPPITNMESRLSRYSVASSNVKVKNESDPANHVAAIKRETDSFSLDDSLKSEAEILQIKIKEEGPEADCDADQIESVEVTLSDGESKSSDDRRIHMESPRLRRKLRGPPVPKTQGDVLPKESSYICSKCGKSFSVDSDLLSHVCISSLYDFQSQDVTPAGEFHCSECATSFPRKAALLEHLRLHKGEKPFACKECGKLFARKLLLQNHQKDHAGGKPFTCTECGKSFSKKFNLIRHEKSSLQIHRKQSTGEKPFPCPYCDKSFSRKFNLLRHEVVHMVEIRCKSCDKSFQQKVSLKIETGEKPFLCSECEKISSDYGKKRTQPFKCPQCGDTFFQKSHLLGHQKVHEREKRFGCPRCAERFPSNKELRKHKKSHRIRKVGEEAGESEKQ
ncbi:gastrula zinc finger protein XlCGF57.1-like isoform X2 [Xenopus laevis]|uniref:Gastrula zinc finger protein XlCGF57.1-like isoform X2 n=1 Tax=Xenopus laevis TaxID=8355 RepID=A0A8J1L592_XENLA|nr:gastrula zinc finger protein XlCGF57.1-like isoform X2 [Xenopus laevis]